MIKFKKDLTQYKEASVNRPILFVEKITFNTKDENWPSRLIVASIVFKISCFDENDREIKSYQVLLTLSQFISAMDFQPILNTCRLISFPKGFELHRDTEDHHWISTVSVSNLEFKNDESLQVYLMSAKKIKSEQLRFEKRIKDWKRRISNLYSMVQSWLIDNSEYKIRIGHPVQMFEEPMESFGLKPEMIDTMDIFHNQKLAVTFKPKGLWVIGANGRIDILSLEGSHTLIDIAEQFNPPRWHIYLMQNSLKSIPFSKQVLLDIL